MKYLIRSLCIVLFLLSAVPAWAQTQLDMNVADCSDYKTADKKLNTVYQQVLKAHKDDELFVAKLKKSQRAWLSFRDAELAAIYPADDKKLEYGSAYPMCNCLEQTALVNQRITQLSAWLSAEEGDVCGGSR